MLLGIKYNVFSGLKIVTKLVIGLCRTQHLTEVLKRVYPSFLERYLYDKKLIKKISSAFLCFLTIVCKVSLKRASFLLHRNNKAV